MSARPADIAVHERAMQIKWKDGHVSTYPHKFLREQCPCAACQGEPDLFGRTSAPHRHPIPEDVRPTGMNEVGRYALVFLWSDGHQTGIYPYDYLRKICQCAECSEKRKVL